MTRIGAVASIAAHAKANLFLRILSRETSGFHSIETLFTLLELADEITVETTNGGVEITVDGAETGPADENLATRAARLVLSATGERCGVRIHLLKHIPVRAGLGGGSSDGAATLHAVNAVLGNPVPRHEILQMATHLGSDVPFLASRAPLALAWGRGERLFRVPAPPNAPVLLVIPPLGVSTPDAYAMLDESRKDAGGRGSVVLDHAAFESWGAIGRLGGNDFESVLFSRLPEMRDLFQRVAETRPLLARLSGSGSAILAVYRNPADRDQAAMILGERNQLLIRTSTRATLAPGATAES